MNCVRCRSKVLPKVLPKVAPKADLEIAMAKAHAKVGHGNGMARARVPTVRLGFVTVSSLAIPTVLATVNARAMGKSPAIVNAETHRAAMLPAMEPAPKAVLATADPAPSAAKHLVLKVHLVVRTWRNKVG